MVRISKHCLPPTEMLSRAQRLTSKEFAQAFAEGRTARHPLLSVRIFHRGSNENAFKNAFSAIETPKSPVRAAFVVPKKQAKAAKRNRLRRRMRECYRQHTVLLQLKDILQGCDLIFIAAPAAHEATFEELNAAFPQLLRRAARLATDWASEKASANS